MKRSMIAAICLMAPLMTKANPQAIEPLTADEKGPIATWVETLKHDRDGRDDRRSDRDRNRSPRAEECEGLTLDDTQKVALKDAKFAFAKDMNLAKANLKNSIMDYGRTLSDANSTRDQGQQSGDAVKSSFNSMGDLKLGFELKVFYDILKPEQREPAMKCIMKHMKDEAAKKLKRACDRLKS